MTPKSPPKPAAEPKVGMVRVGPEMYALVQERAKVDSRTVTAVVHLALIAYFSTLPLAPSPGRKDSQ